MISVCRHWPCCSQADYVPPSTAERRRKGREAWKTPASGRRGLPCGEKKKKGSFADHVPSRWVVMRSKGQESEKKKIPRTMAELKGMLLQRIGSLLVIAISMRD